MVLSLPVSQRRGIHQRGSGFAQRQRTRMQCRAGGEHIVDDDIAGVRVDGHRVSYHERSGDVLAAFLSSEPRLRDGLMPLAEQELRATSGDVRGQEGRDALRLIVAPLELTGRVQWNWHQHRSCKVAAEDIIRERRMGEVVGQERAPFVLDAMDDPAGGAAGTEGADRPGEGRLKIEAVRAGAGAFEDAFEGVTAGQAPWVMDAGESVGPGCG